MTITLDGTTGITTPGLTNTGTETLVNLTTTGNTTLGDATTDTLTVGVTGIVKDASGNVGIGTSSPAAKLDLYTNQAAGFIYPIFFSANNSASAKTNYLQLGFSVQQGAAGSETGGFDLKALRNNTPVYLANYEGAAGAAAWRFYTEGTERMRIDSSGNLLVGTTSVFTGTYAVNVMGAAGNRSYLGLKRETASTTGVCGSIQSFNGANTIGAIDFAANGANNSGLIQTYTWSAGSAVQGPYVNTGGTSWTTASDETLKDIIAPIEEATSKLSGLRTVFGKYKTDHDDVRRIFLIAQDVQAVLPEAVSTDGNGKLGLNYQDLVPVLVKAIQELKSIIDTQASTIQSLTTRITALEAK